MSPSQQQLIKDLFSGMYLLKTVLINGNPVYKLYRGNQIPVRYISAKIVDKGIISSLLKPNKKSRLVISIAAVRKLDGRNWIKKYYKSLHANSNENK